MTPLVTDRTAPLKTPGAVTARRPVETARALNLLTTSFDAVRCAVEHAAIAPRRP